jgi:hypothetical protein
MKTILKNLLILVVTLLTLCCGGRVIAEDLMLDAFEELQGWSIHTSPGVRVELAHDAGYSGLGMRIDFDFQGDGGYFIVHKAFPLKLPENYAFSFMLRGEAPVNNLEFKLIDPSSKNVWWYTQRDYAFPKEWQHITVKKKHLQFAWGPAGGGFPTQLGALELAISAGTGGKGSIWIDDLQFEKREPVGLYGLRPTVSASTSTAGHEPEKVLDLEPVTGWHSGSLGESQWLLVDFLRNREYGGLVIDWQREDYATAYQVQTSDDGINWKTAYTVALGNGGRDYIYMPDAESRYLRLELQKSSRGQGYGILAINLKPYEFSSSINQFFEAIARDAPPGRYPKYFYGQQTYWTVVGVNGDDKEGLLNEEGMLEVDKGSFSIEPFLYTDGRLITWEEVTPVQELEQGYLPIPSVIWRHDPLLLRITACATGKPGATVLYARYRLTNTSSKPQHVKLFLALRPFQVNPPWQSLTVIGGVAPIRELAYEEGKVWVNREKAVVPLTTPDRFGAIRFEQGPLTRFLLGDKLLPQDKVSDPFSYASGALEYGMDLPPRGTQEIYLAIPFHDPKLTEAMTTSVQEASAWGRSQFEEATRYWKTQLDRVDIRLPPPADRMIRTLKSTLAYILINRVGLAIQPGPRNYARSWIRDGAFIAAALLEMGYTEEVRTFIKWFASYQFADGKIPCCVDQRGPDTVAENDSQGEFIYTVMEYYRYTRDVGFLTELWPTVVKAVEYIDWLRRQRLTDAYKTPELRQYYGLLPESISHEGYMAHPVHSYWDDFFALRGLKDAADMAVVLGDEEKAASFAALRDDFRKDLYASIDLAMKKHNIDYIPGSVELGDFDPSATTIAVDPGGELLNLPEPALSRTFEDYYTYFLLRGNGQIDWNNYTPYELRIVGIFVRLGQRRRALEALDFFLADQRPSAWNQWAEVVWRDPKTPSFIGDMPHTWIGAGYIRSLRSLFVYEREADQSLVIAAGLPREWVESATGVSVKRLPTYYGTLNYSLHQEAPGELHLQLSGDLTLPPGKLVIKPPVALQTVTVNGKAITTFNADSATIAEFPADVVLRY